MMGYFSNGTDGIIWEEKNCRGCIHDDDGCAVMMAHLLHNYDQCDNKTIRSILECLIPTGENGFPGKCQMFKPDTDTKLSEKIMDLQRENSRLAAKVTP